MKFLTVPLGDRAYRVAVGAGARQSISEWVRAEAGGARVAIIADETVIRLHSATLRSAVPGAIELPFPAGEQSKCLEVAGRLYARLAAERLERQDVIIAFGGGVAGDLGGFVAATWLRGVRFIQAPTTLEAAVDAAVGGKTAVNLAAGKNLVGVFHQPSLVAIDTDFLATLPQRDFAAGLAESAKHAAIRDPAFLAWHEEHADALARRESDALAELIARNVEIKAEVVAADERESGLRAILNYGHTIGHACEHLLEYALRHGECVGLGIVVENEISVARGWLPRGDAERIADLLGRLGLPRRLPWALRAEEVCEAVRQDKKSRRGAVHYSLLEALGRPRRADDVADDEVRAALRAIAPLDS